MHYDIVIVGGGAGGLELAAALGRKLAFARGGERVLLIDQALFHIWKPTLHEVAAGTLNIHQEGLSYPILARRNHFSFALGEMVGLDTRGKRVSLKGIYDEDGRTIVPERAISFTWGALAIGGGSNFFQTPGAAEHALVLDQTSDAERFHTRLLAAFTRACFADARTLAVTIVGGGATGVELSAELLEAHSEFQQCLGPAQRFRLDVTLVEAADRILVGLPEKISTQATIALERRGVRIHTGARVSAVFADRLETSAGFIAADLVVWAAGIKANEANAAMGLTTNSSHQFEVDDHLATSAADIFAFGDCAACRWTPDKLVPARAQAAHQQAAYLYRLLMAKVTKKALPKPFVYRDFGSLVSLGENWAIGSLMGSLAGRNFLVEGLIAKWMYMSLHLAHHRAILGSTQTVILAAARLLQQRVSGRLKLH
jgi:NADH dehydrogenase